MRRSGATAGFSSLVALQLDRVDAALADLGRARGRRGPPAVGAGTPDAGRLAQVLANLIANAAEHGAGPVEVRWARRRPRAARDPQPQPAAGARRPRRPAGRRPRPRAWDRQARRARAGRRASRWRATARRRWPRWSCRRPRARHEDAAAARPGAAGARPGLRRAGRLAGARARAQRGREGGTAGAGGGGGAGDRGRPAAAFRRPRAWSACRRASCRRTRWARRSASRAPAVPCRSRPGRT